MNKKNLLITTSTFPRWKKDTDPPFVFELAKRLTGAFNVTVLAPGFPGALSNEIMEGVEVHRFRYFLKRFEILAGTEGILPTLKKNKLFFLLVPFFILAQFIALLSLVKKNKPDVIHAHWILPQGFIAALAQKITRVPYIVTTHGGDIYGLQGRFAGFFKSFALRNAMTVTVVSKDIQDTIKHTFGEDIHTDIVPMGVDAELFNPTRKNDQLKERYGITGPFLLFVGRLTEKKGVEYLIKAMPVILKKYPDSKLLIIGTGEIEQQLTQLVNSFGMQKQIIFTGAIPNKELPAYFATADIFIGPSVKAVGGDTEGFGLTFVEAGMSGCFVIGTDVGGIGDIIEHGKTGFLVKERDSEQLAQTITMILDNGDELNHMKEATIRILCKKFCWPAIAERYKKILSPN
jgi:glycosyltransferase involved in cell wall biosynthesis